MPDRSRLRRIAAIVRKDALLFARDRFFVAMTAAGLVFYVAVFWLLPGSAQATVRVGVTGGDLGPVADLVAASREGLELERFDSGEALRRAVAGEGERTVTAGIELPEEFVARVAAGRTVDVRLYLGAGVPDGLRATVSGLVEELGFQLAGRPPPVEISPEQLLVGDAGGPVPLREQLRPLLVFAALLVEMLALATLVAGELQLRTVTAVLVTPTRVADVMAAKTILGTGLAFTEATLILLATGSLATSPALLLTAVLLGSVLVTGLALLAGSTGRDFMGIIFWSMLLMIPMLIPALGTLFPGATAGWIRALPSWGLVEAIVGATAEGAGWAALADELALLAGWCVLALVAGLGVLSRAVSRA